MFLGLLLETRMSAIDYFFPLSPEVFLFKTRHNKPVTFTGKLRLKSFLAALRMRRLTGENVGLITRR